MNDHNPQHNQPKILLIEDSMSHALIYMKYLSKSALHATHVDTGGAGLIHIKQTPPELVLLDLELPDIPGMSILKYINDNRIPCTVVILTGHGSINIAVEAMQAGAFDFLTKPFDAHRFNDTIKNALENQSLNQKICRHKEDFKRQQYNGFIGASESMQHVYRMIDSVASSKASVFIGGESGTGKELCAQAVHERSPRSKANFIALNCASIPKELMESEFFGHVKGAFTGAHTEREGAVQQANGGTLFLDEICEMDLNLQSKLLRFIQTGIYRKVGSDKERKVDIRFVCATNRSPLEEVSKGNFREDLYYRLHVIPINLPPLRDRDRDAVLIANYLLKIYAAEENKNITGFSPEAEQVLYTYQWPGNVRQMQNVIRMIAVLNDAEQISAAMLPPPLDSVKVQPIDENASSSTQSVAEHHLPSAYLQNQVQQDNQAQVAQNLPLSKTAGQFAGAEHNPVNAPAAAQTSELPQSEKRNEEMYISQSDKIEPFGVYERQIIEAAILKCAGNVPEAAAQLALSPSTLYRKIQSWRADKR